MERISPIDLESARFPTVRKGYDPDAVHAMLKSASTELESLLTELQALKAQHALESKELGLYRKKESTLADALILAQKTADETRAAAHKEAELIIEHAKRQADDIRRAAQDEAGNIERKLEQRIQDKKNFESRFRLLLEDYLKTLNESPSFVIEEQKPVAG